MRTKKKKKGRENEHEIKVRFSAQFSHFQLQHTAAVSNSMRHGCQFTPVRNDYTLNPILVQMMFFPISLTTRV